MEKSPIPSPVILHSMASPSTVAWVMHQKFVNALPLYRQENEWITFGVNLSRATIANWIMAASRYWLKSVVERLHQKLIQSWMSLAVIPLAYKAIICSSFPATLF